MDFEFSWLSMVIRPEGGFLDSPARENFTNELAAIGVALSLIFIAFSREEIEDEYIMKLRLESLLVAVLVNYGLLLLAIAFIYSMGFFLALVYNMYTILILFIARFYWVKHKQQKLLAS